MIQEEEHRIPGERAETVTGRRIDQNPVLKRGAVALAVVAFIGFALWSTTGKKAQDEDFSRSASSFARPRRSRRPRRRSSRRRSSRR